MSGSTRDVLDTIASVLLRCWILGIVLQFITFAAIHLMGDAAHDIYGIIFGLSNEKSDVIIVVFLSLIKLCVALFFFIPWVAIKLVLRTAKS